MNISKSNKIVILTLVGLLLVLGGGYVGYRTYVSLRQKDLLKQARFYMAKPDERRAMLVLQRAIRSNPRDVEACKLMAELAEKANSKGALMWRGRVVDLLPNSTDDRFILARSALLWKEFSLASSALQGLNAEAKKTAAYHRLAASVALMTDQPAEAETHFLEAIRLEPPDLPSQLNLAVVRLTSTNDAVKAQARATVKSLSSNPTNASLRCQALRELALDAVRSKQTNAALTLSRQLLAETNAPFTDRLLGLKVLQVTRHPDFRRVLAGLQREASNTPELVQEMAGWQLANASAVDMLAWVRTLPPAVQTNQTMLLMTAQGLTKTRNWRGLQSSLREQYWAELDFVRHAFLAQALRAQDLTGASKAEWELSLKLANNQKEALVLLLNLVAEWNWISEGEELLWSIVNRYPGEEWAAQALMRVLVMNGRTRPLLTLFNQQATRNPNDLQARNNLAMTAFLLEAQEFRPHELAKELHDRMPTNAVFASTYAYSLYLQSKPAEALKVMEKLNARDLESPSVAGYYGLILKANGKPAAAATYLKWAFKGPVLPEERRLFEKALATP